MIGDTLYPLNVLKGRWPDIYTSAVAKYVGREAIMEANIPTLNCFWNDVLHLTPIHPAKIASALNEAGLKLLPERKWYKIPVHQIQKDPMIVFETKAYMSRNGSRYGFLAEYVQDFKNFSEVSEVPS